MTLPVRFKPRPTRILHEVCESDLLTAQESYIKGTMGGYYSLADEKCYFRVSGEKATITVDEFERMIKNIHPQFFVIFNPMITQKHMIEGHNIGFYVPEFGGFVPLCRVGRSGNNIITANSQGSVEKYIGSKTLKEKEKVVISRGYVAAAEFCKQFIFDAVKTGGIQRSRIIRAAEYMVFKDMKTNIGGAEAIDKIFKEAKILAETEMDKMILASKVKEESVKELTQLAAEEFDNLSKIEVIRG